MLLPGCYVKEKIAAGQQWLIVREGFIHSTVMVQFAKTPQNSPCNILKLLGFWSVVLSSLSLQGLIACLISWYRKSNKYFQRRDYPVFLSIHVSNAGLASVWLHEEVCLGPTLFGLNILLWFYSWIILHEKWSLRFGTFLSVKVVWESSEDAFHEDGERQNIKLVADHEINKRYPNHVWADYNRFPQTLMYTMWGLFRKHMCDLTENVLYAYF